MGSWGSRWDGAVSRVYCVVYLELELQGGTGVPTLGLTGTPHILVDLSHGPNSGTAGESALQKIDYSDAPACGEGFPGRQPKDRDGLQIVPWDVPSHVL